MSRTIYSGGPAPRAARGGNHPPKSSGEIASSAPAPRRFADSGHWDQLATVCLSRYTLPAWDVAFSPDAAEIWLDRLSLPRAAWLAVGNFRALEEFAALNPGWPLRAAVGLMLELRHERNVGAE